MTLHGDGPPNRLLPRFWEGRRHLTEEGQIGAVETESVETNSRRAMGVPEAIWVQFYGKRSVQPVQPQS